VTQRNSPETSALIRSQMVTGGGARVSRRWHRQPRPPSRPERPGYIGRAKTVRSRACLRLALEVVPPRRCAAGRIGGEDDVRVKTTDGVLVSIRMYRCRTESTDDLVQRMGESNVSG